METMVIFTLVFAGVSLWMVAGIWRDSLLAKQHLAELRTMVVGLNLRLTTYEKYFDKLGTGLNQLVAIMNSSSMDSPGYHTMYRTMDGKYTATSIEDLLAKIRRDGLEKEYLSDEEIDGLRKMFQEEDDEDDDGPEDILPFEK
jgi:hypothetical protein